MIKKEERQHSGGMMQGGKKLGPGTCEGIRYALSARRKAD